MINAMAKPKELLWESRKQSTIFSTDDGLVNWWYVFTHFKRNIMSLDYKIAQEADAKAFDVR